MNLQINFISENNLYWLTLFNSFGKFQKELCKTLMKYFTNLKTKLGINFAEKICFLF